MKWAIKVIEGTGLVVWVDEGGDWTNIKNERVVFTSKILALKGLRSWKHADPHSSDRFVLVCIRNKKQTIVSRLDRIESELARLVHQIANGPQSLDVRDTIKCEVDCLRRDLTFICRPIYPLPTLGPIESPELYPELTVTCQNPVVGVSGDFSVNTK